MGGNSIDYNLTNAFNNTLNDCDLNDLGYYGIKYTWANNQVDNHHIKERIDRFCANTKWTTSFPRFSNKHLIRYTSDHNLILLEFHEANAFNHNQARKKAQKFENIWAQDKDIVQIVKHARDNFDGGNHLKLQHTLDQLSNWGKAKYGEIPSKIKEQQTLLETLRNIIPIKECIHQVKLIEETLDDLLKKEDIWWAQRAKTHWLKQVDLNTKFFHEKANQRKRRNQIYSIQDTNENLWKNIQNTFMSYFQHIFTSSNHPIRNETFEVVNNRINQQDYDTLNAAYNSTEVCNAIRALKSNFPLDQMAYLPFFIITIGTLLVLTFLTLF